MAYRVKGCFRQLPDDIHNALANTKRYGSTVTLKYMKGKGLKPLTPLSEIKELAEKASTEDTPVVITSKRFDNFAPKADGLATEFEEGDYQISLHPVLQYYPKSYIKEIIKHEKSHIKVFKKRKGVQKPRCMISIA